MICHCYLMQRHPQGHKWNVRQNVLTTIATDPLLLSTVKNSKEMSEWIHWCLFTFIWDPSLKSGPCLQQSPRCFFSFTNYSVGLGPRSSFHSWRLTAYRLTDGLLTNFSRKFSFWLISHHIPHQVSSVFSDSPSLVLHCNYLGRDPRPCFFHQPPCLQMRTFTPAEATVIYLLVILKFGFPCWLRQ